MRRKADYHTTEHEIAIECEERGTITALAHITEHRGRTSIEPPDEGALESGELVGLSPAEVDEVMDAAAEIEAQIRDRIAEEKNGDW